MSREGLSISERQSILTSWRQQKLPVDDALLAEIADWFKYCAHIEVDPNDIAHILSPHGKKCLYTAAWPAEISAGDIANKLMGQCSPRPGQAFNQLIFLLLEPERAATLRGRLSALTVGLRAVAGEGSRALWLADCPEGEQPVARLLMAECESTESGSSDNPTFSFSEGGAEIAEEDLPMAFRGISRPR